MTSLNKSTTDLLLGFLNDVVVAGGAIVGTAMGQAGSTELPSMKIFLFALAVGVYTAAMRAQARINPAIDAPRSYEALLEKISQNTKFMDMLATRISSKMVEKTVVPGGITFNKKDSS